MIASSFAPRADAQPEGTSTNEVSPPRPVYVAAARLDRVVVAPLEGPRVVLLLDFAVTGPAKTHGALPPYSREAPFDDAGCKRLYTMNETTDPEHEARLRALIGTATTVVQSPGKCSEDDGRTRATVDSVGDVKLLPPTDWRPIALRQKNAFLPFAKTVAGFSCPPKPAWTYCRDHVLETVLQINTEEALETALALRPFAMYVHESRIRPLPRAFDIVQKATLENGGRYLEVLWPLSPTRTLALIEEHFHELSGQAADLHDPRVYEVMEAKYVTLTPPHREFLLFAMVSSNITLGPDELQRPFLERAVGGAAENTRVAAVWLPEAKKQLAILDARKQANAYDLAKLAASMKSKDGLPESELSPLLRGMRLRVGGTLGRMFSSLSASLRAEAGGVPVVVEFALDAEEWAKVDTLRGDAGLAGCTVEGVVESVTYYSGEARFKLKFARLTAGSLPRLPWQPAAPRASSKCGCRVVGDAGGSGWVGVGVVGAVAARRRRR